MKTIFLILTLIISFNFSILPQKTNKKITLAVLYFENNSVVDKDKVEPLKKGIADMLITDLNKVKSFKIVERERLNDIMQELNLNQTSAVDQSTAQKMGKLLGAQTLLLGSYVNFYGDQIRVDLRILETETGLTLKAEEVTDDIEDLFDIINELALKVTEEFDIQLSSEEKDQVDIKRGEINLEASLLYSKAVDTEDAAREKYKNGDNRGAIKDYTTAIDLFKAAFIKNPTLVEAKEKADMLQNYIVEINLPELKLSKNDLPVINLLEPVSVDNKDIICTESIIALRMNIQDESGIKEVNVNNIPCQKTSGGEFIANIPLSGGLNNIHISAMNIKDLSTEKSFRVIIPGSSGTIISISDPPVSRGIKIVSKKELITVKGTAIDPAGMREVFINNKRAALKQDGTFNLEMNLAPGDNLLIVRAVNTLKIDKIDTFIVRRDIEELIASGRYIALTIGINAYTGYWHPLANALNDAKGMAELLKSEYKFDTVLTLYDKEATRKNIIQKLEWLAANLKTEDNLLIFYSGHGQLNKVLNKGYWVPVDAVSNSVADYISNSDIKIFLGGIPSKHTMLIADACFAGDIFRGSTEQEQFDPNNMEKYYKEVYRKQSRLALTSGGLEEVMDAGKEGHSVFTYYLLKALKENNKKYIDASQLFNEFSPAVTNNSEQTPQLQSVKDTNHEGGQFIFVKR